MMTLSILVVLSFSAIHLLEFLSYYARVAGSISGKAVTGYAIQNATTTITRFFYLALMPMLGFDAADQPTLQIVHGGEQRQGAVADIVMGLRADVADAQWQAWLRALQSLNLALFIAAEHQRLIRWSQVQADNVPEFFFELRIIGQLEGAGEVRLDVVGSPDPLNAGRRNTSDTRHATAAPAWLTDARLSDLLKRSLQGFGRQ